MWIWILSIILLLLLYRYLHSKQYPPNFPPGPRHPIPYLGDPLFAIGKDSIVGFQRLHKQYGPIVGVNFCGMRIVSINDLELMQKTFALDEFSDRPMQPGFNDLRGGLVADGSPPGLLNSNGNVWKDMRRFTLQTLRDFGFGKSSMNEIISDEFNYLSKKLEATGGNPIETKDMFNVLVLNAVWRIMASDRLDPDLPKVQRTMSLIETIFETGGSSLAFIAFSNRRISDFFDAIGIMKTRETLDAMWAIIDEIIADHEATFDENNIRDFIDVFLMKKLHPASRPEEISAGRKNLRNIFLDLFLAGGETTSNSLKWSVIYMIENPSIQEKVQQELDEVASQNPGVPFIELRSQLQYVEAVIQEIQRLGNIAAMALMHATTKPTVVAGYSLPKNTYALPFLSSTMMSPDLFPNPEVFKPERFLNDLGQFVPNSNLVPFGVGKRRCLGEALAKAELFIFFTSLVHKFQIKWGGDGPGPSRAYTPGITRAPHPFKARFIARF